MQRLTMGVAVTGAMAAGMMIGLALPQPAWSEVVITEIMYNPASPEMPPVRTEWVEIYNTSDEAVDLTGWYLQDEDGRTQPLAEGATIGAKQAVVLIPKECTAEAFHAAWGETVRVYPLASWSGRGSLSGLANQPTETNEVLTLRDAAGQLVDEVNYLNTSPWPSGKGQGASIYLIPGVIRSDFNDDGARWRFSQVDLHGGRSAVDTDVFSARDIGSPGVVVAVIEE